MTITWKRGFIGVSIVVLVGTAVWLSGIVPIKASSGHWPITAWLLNVASTRSIAFHSRGVPEPAPFAEANVTLGAATYHSNCQFCHGQPGRGLPPMAGGMTPTPPRLAESVPDFDRKELFYVLKHGVKFAGMPAWPTQQRDEEIWPVVDFLEAYPKMTYGEFLRRTGPPESWIDKAASSGQAGASQHSAIRSLVAHRCAACHGMDGNGRAGDRVPRLAGQTAAYLKQSLLAYRATRRHSGVMMPIAYRLNPLQIDRLADYFAGQPIEVAEPNEAAWSDSLSAQIRHGERLARRGSRAGKVASCTDCHGPAEALRRDDYPRLAGQPIEYLIRQLELFDSRSRGGSENASLMHPIADSLTAEQRRAVAAFYHYAAGGETDAN
jgi:cytochrome c553